MPAKLTKEIVNERLSERGIVLVGEYVNSSIKALFRGPCGHEWAASPVKVLRETGCPFCAGNISLTKDSVNARISDRGLELIGGYVNARTKALFRCRKGHEWLTTPGGVMSGKGCPTCSGCLPLSKEIVNTRIRELGIEMLGEYTTSGAKALFRCPEGHEWLTTPDRVMGGYGCHPCSGLVRLSAKVVNERIEARGIAIIGGYVNSGTKALFRCAEGHEWVTTPGHVLNGTGCPVCTPRGFNPTKPGTLYYLRITPQPGVTLYKIGITNKTVSQRFNNSDLEMIEVVKTWDYPIGAAAHKEEQRLLKCCRADQYTGPNVLESGNTELFTSDVLRLDTMAA